MRIDILTLFPKMFSEPFAESILRRAQDKSLAEINIHNLRNWGLDERKTVDDRPYGGGTGMLIRVDVVANALAAINSKFEARNPKQIQNSKSKIQNFKSQISCLASGRANLKSRVVLLDAGGKKYDQKMATKLSRLDNLILICGHYEGVDHRVAEHLVDEVISIGDYILTGGEIPAMVVVDSVVRLIPKVLVKSDATKFESFSSILTTHNPQPTTILEYPQYTRPEDFNSWKVPKILLSGNHAEIAKWRGSQSEKLTRKFRPDLLEK